MASPTAPLTPQQLQQLLNGPAEKPPPGVLPNFNDPSNLDTAFIITLTFCITFATLAFLLRIYTKIFLIRSVAYEDCEYHIIYVQSCRH